MPMGGGRGVTVRALCWFCAKGSHICFYDVCVYVCFVFLVGIVPYNRYTHIIHTG